MIISCPHCKWDEKDSLINNKKNQIVRCKKCGHFYTFIEEESASSELYSSEAYKLDDQRKSIFFKIQRWEYKDMLGKVLTLIKKRDDNLSILDFGSGKGHLLSFARQLGFETFGIETATERASFAIEKYKLTISNDYYTGEGMIMDRNYDVITLIHVLEHLSEPELIITGLFDSNLKENGIMVVEVPNISSWQAKIGGAHWLHLDIPRHINHYSVEYLSNFLTKVNGVMLKKETLSFHLGFIGMLQSLMSLFGYKNSLIVDLKFNKNAKLMLSVFLLILPAFFLELVASIFGKGGIIRIYIKK
jgi:2-polyprenyl-3-methyl-5-hydroxy-6-metoxy-1,4-benzoquinol methylase